MFMSAMVQIFSWCERWNMFHSMRRSRVEWNISCFTDWKYLFHCTNEKTFINDSFLLASFLERRCEDCIGNTEHSNVNVTTESNNKSFLHSCRFKWSVLGCFVTWCIVNIMNAIQPFRGQESLYKLYYN